MVLFLYRLFYIYIFYHQMYQKMLNEYNEQIENEDMKINYDYSLKNYINMFHILKIIQ